MCQNIKTVCLLSTKQERPDLMSGLILYLIDCFKWNTAWNFTSIILPNSAVELRFYCIFCSNRPKFCSRIYLFATFSSSRATFFRLMQSDCYIFQTCRCKICSNSRLFLLRFATFFAFRSLIATFSRAIVRFFVAGRSFFCIFIDY